MRSETQHFVTGAGLVSRGMQGCLHTNSTTVFVLDIYGEILYILDVIFRICTIFWIYTIFYLKNVQSRNSIVIFFEYFQYMYTTLYIYTKNLPKCTIRTKTEARTKLKLNHAKHISHKQI